MLVAVALAFYIRLSRHRRRVTIVDAPQPRTPNTV
jgi:hypothetical protein